MYATTYHKAASAEEAATAMANAEDGKILAGGQTLIPTMKARLAAPSDLVSLAGAGLSGVTASDGAVTIGAMTTHAEVAAHPDVPAVLASLANGIGAIVAPSVGPSPTTIRLQITLLPAWHLGPRSPPTSGSSRPATTSSVSLKRHWKRVRLSPPSASQRLTKRLTRSSQTQPRAMRWLAFSWPNYVATSAWQSPAQAKAACSAIPVWKRRLPRISALQPSTALTSHPTGFCQTCMVRMNTARR